MVRGLMVLSLFVLVSCGMSQNYQSGFDLEESYHDILDQIEREKYNEALVSLVRFEEDARRCRDYKYVGKALEAKASLYFKQYDYVRSEKYFRQSLPYFLRCDSSAVYGVCSELVEINRRMGRNQIAVRLNESLIEYYSSANDMRSLAECLRNKAELILESPGCDTQEAIGIYERLIHDSNYEYSQRLKSYLAYAEAISGQADNACLLIKDVGMSNDYKVLSMVHKTYEMLGDYRLSSEYSNALLELQDSVFRRALWLSSESDLSNHHSLEKERLRKATEKRISLQLLLLVLLLVASVVTVVVIVSRLILINREKYALRSEVDSMNVDYSEKIRLLKESNSKLLRAQFVIISSFYDKNSPDSTEKDWLTYVRRELFPVWRSIRKGAGRDSEFERFLDNRLGGLVTQSRAAMKDMKESDFVLLGYLLAGFSTSSIARIMNMTKENVLIRKHRLVKRIRSEDFERKEKLLFIVSHR